MEVPTAADVSRTQLAKHGLSDQMCPPGHGHVVAAGHGCPQPGKWRLGGGRAVFARVWGSRTGSARRCQHSDSGRQPCSGWLLLEYCVLRTAQLMTSLPYAATDMLYCTHSIPDRMTSHHRAVVRVRTRCTNCGRRSGQTSLPLMPWGTLRVGSSKTMQTQLRLCV